jgi:polyisoprenoid-binding protein YceI
MRRLILVLAVLALVVAACGGDDQSETTTSLPEATSTTTGDAAGTTTTVPRESTSAGPVTFTVGEGTEARFVIEEVLRGEDTTVVGANPNVEVSATVDFDAGTVDVGPVTIDAAAFVTDEDRRNGAINRFILDTGSHPTITFAPTDLSGLTSDGGTITGDLTIRDVTNSVTFEVTVSEASPEGITASATATIDRTDWGLDIPSVPFVASVAEEVLLELDLVLVPSA